MNKNTKRWLIDHHRFLTLPLVFLILINIVMSLGAIFFAFYSKETIDYAIEGNTSLFILSAVILSTIMLVQLIMLALNQFAKVYYKGMTDRHLKNHLFGGLLKKKTEKLTAFHSGVYVNHLTSDVENVSDGLIDIIPRFVFYVVRFFGAFILLFVLDYLFALLFLGLGAVLFLASRLMSQEMKKRHHALQDTQANVRSFMQESIENVPVIKTFEAETTMGMKLDDLQRPYFNAKLHKNKLNILAFSGMNFFFAFGLAFAIIFGAWRLQAGFISVGGLMAIIQLVNQIQSPFSGLSTLLPRYHEMLASTERLMLIDGMEDEVKMAQENTETFQAIEIKNIVFNYGNKTVLNDYNLTLRKGESIHISADSGRGKTTLLKLLLGLIEPDEGSIKLKLTNKAINCNASTRNFFSYVPQGNFILSGSIRENLELYQNVEKVNLDHVCKIACIYDDIMKLPKGYETVIGEKGYGLSEGQIQRLAIARALIKDAPVLLLDEVTSALDKETEANVLENIIKVIGKTCLVVTHRDLSPHLGITKINL